MSREYGQQSAPENGKQGRKRAFSRHERKPSRYAALVGAPNCGKTTLFNALTGLHQTVGNYPGVTVERKVGVARTAHGGTAGVIDLPGAYSLIPRSPDEQVTRDVLLSLMRGERTPDMILCVLDACGIERQFPFILQVLELGLPTALVLNRMDRAELAGVVIDPALLSARLGGIPVIPAQANAGRGIVEIRHLLSSLDLPAPGRLWRGGDEMEALLAEPVFLTDGERRNAVTLLSDSRYAGGQTALPAQAREDLAAREQKYREQTGRSLDEEISLARIRAAADILSECAQSHKSGADDSLTPFLDSLFLHRYWGWFFFALFFFLMFWLVFAGGGLPSEGLGWVQKELSALVTAWLEKGPLQDLLVNGLIAGVFGVLRFLPQILLLFLFIGILESSGYMARASYLMDGVMRKAGLPGKAFIPLLSSYACALPGSLAARIVPNDRDRLLTLLILPWISCSARLPVYILMISLLFTAAGIATAYQGLALFLLYVLGTVAALVVARLIRPLVTREAPTPLLLELPAYQFPDFRYIGKMLFMRLGLFLKKVGTIVALFTVFLWVMTSYPKGEEPARQAESSYIGQIGRALEPVFAPLGYDWRITTGLLSSFVAREMFNSHMSVLFSTDGAGADAEDTGTLQQQFEAAARPDGSRLFTPAVCVSILVFYVFALQCFASMAALRREMGSLKWSLIQFLGMGLFAYGAAWLAYRLAGAVFA